MGMLKFIMVAAIAAGLAGCVSSGPSQDTMAKAAAYKQQRDAKQITWTQWANLTIDTWKQEGRRLSSSESAQAAYILVVAERVDGKRLTPAEGNLLILSLIADEDRRVEADNRARRAAFGAALQSAGQELTRAIPPPVKRTTCTRQFNQIQCETQ